MNKEQVARCLILQYLENCANTDAEHIDELGVSIDCLKNLWGIENPEVKLPGVKSILDLIPDVAYDAEKAVDLKNQGNKALQSGNVDEAIRLYSEAIKCDPTQYVFYSNRAAAYSKKDNYEEAIKDAEKAISLKPDFPKSYSRLGFALWKLGRVEEARDAYKRGIRSCEDNQSLKDNLASLGPEKEAEKPQGAAGADPLGGLGAMFANNPMLAQFADRLNDPKVKEMLQQPEMVELIQQLQSNPSQIMQMMGDPRVMKLLGAIMGNGQQ